MRNGRLVEGEISGEFQFISEKFQNNIINNIKKIPSNGVIRVRIFMIYITTVKG